MLLTVPAGPVIVQLVGWPVSAVRPHCGLRLADGDSESLVIVITGATRSRTYGAITGVPGAPSDGTSRTAKR